MANLCLRCGGGTDPGYTAPEARCRCPIPANKDVIKELTVLKTVVSAVTAHPTVIQLEVGNDGSWHLNIIDTTAGSEAQFETLNQALSVYRTHIKTKLAQAEDLVATLESLLSSIG